MAKKTFITALQFLEDGESAKRKGWEGGNIESVSLNAQKDGFLMKMKGGANIPWTPSNEDIFADDWEMV